MKIWLNQNLFYYKDLTYSSNGSIEISISSSTIDYKTFSPLSINLSISNDKIKRSANLSHHNVLDLLNSIKQLTLDAENMFKTNRDNEIFKKYHSDKSIKIKFITAQNTNERVVIISILFNDTDFTKVVIPYNQFTSICYVLKSFVSDYINLNLNFNFRILMTEILDQTKAVKDNIKALPGFISNQSFNNSNLAIINSEEIKDNIPEFENTDIENKIEDLDKFLQENLSSIKIPEIDKANELISEKIEIKNIIISSLLIDHLGCDLERIESTVNSSIANLNPLATFSKIISSSVKNISTLLPDISDDDYKSCCYISSILIKLCMKRFVDNKEPIPSSLPILKYDIKRQPNKEEIELALDLMIAVSYIKLFRSKVEIRESSGIKNRSIVLLGLRCISDPFVFSVLYKIKPDVVRNLLIERYKYFKSIGLFSKYETLLDNYNLNSISEKEMIDILTNISINVIPKSENIKLIHDTYVKDKLISVPYKNDLNLEQIINEVIPLDVLKYFKIDINDPEVQSKYNIHYNASSPTMKYFQHCALEQKAEDEPQRRKNRTNLVRAVESVSGDIPQQMRKEFLKYIEELKNENFDFLNDKYPIEEFGDEIIKILYIWNESNKKESYSDFSVKIENCIMDKASIISKYKNYLIKNDDEPKEKIIGLNQLSSWFED